MLEFGPYRLDARKRLVWNGEALLEVPPKAAEHVPPVQQMALFAVDNPLLDELRTLDANTMTPVEALNKLFEWQARFRKA